MKTQKTKRRQMPENVEITAFATDFKTQRAIAESLSDEPLTILNQHDTFYNCAFGRLKLRIFSDSYGELISYQRPDTQEAKKSTYEIYPTDNPSILNAALSKSLGILGVVKKTRYLYFVGQTRIHLDDVLNLGQFIEFEYVLEPEEVAENGQKAVLNLMTKMNIIESDLVSHAYIDLLLSDQ